MVRPPGSPRTNYPVIVLKSDSVAPPGWLRQTREHSERTLGADQAEQFNVVENRHTTGIMIPRRAKRGQDQVVEMDLKCAMRVLRSVFTYRVYRPPPMITAPTRPNIE